MTTLDLNALYTFIIRAKAATYVGSGQKLLPYRLGSHDLQFFDGDWAYHDSLSGRERFHRRRDRLLSAAGRVGDELLRVHPPARSDQPRPRPDT